MSRYDNNYRGWAPYVPVAQRRANSRKEMAKLTGKGQKIEPIEISGRKIAQSFWGKGWCDHLETFGDYSNRLPRGRTYARNGSICHLAIHQGKVEAVVSGSSLYRIDVEIEPLKPAKWKRLKQSCTGKIGSLLELLQGKLSDEIMAVVTDEANGLLPLSSEIGFKCNCPDWANMCKHIAAVMYGIGARLDTQPELLFLLRGVDHEELINTDTAGEAITGKDSSRTSRRRTLSAGKLSDVFGIELDDSRPKPKTKKTAKKKTTARKATKKKAPFKPTARSVKSIRRRFGMNQVDFAEVIGVSAASIRNWEQASAPLKLREKSRSALAWLNTQDPDEYRGD
ncbi:MAG: putative Zn finger protein [Verrucomicrobiales bacterium]|jgi:uncharacterized Zn finger protein